MGCSKSTGGVPGDAPFQLMDQGSALDVVLDSRNHYAEGISAFAEETCGDLFCRDYVDAGKLRRSRLARASTTYPKGPEPHKASPQTGSQSSPHLMPPAR